jgi:hypothetical protein
MSCVIYNDSECHTPKLSTFLAFYPFARRQFARAPVCQSASFARAPVLPERQFCQSASFARASASPERQFAKVPVSFARAPVC